MKEPKGTERAVDTSERRRLLPSQLWCALIIAVIAALGCVGDDAAPNHNLIISDNELVNNGFGVYIGWFGAWDIAILNNVIRDNGEGIRVINRAAWIEGNDIVGNVAGIRVDDYHEDVEVATPDCVLIRANRIEGNLVTGIENLSQYMVQASGNWWGSESGPRTTTRIDDNSGVNEASEAPIEEHLSMASAFYQGWAMFYDPIRLFSRRLTDDTFSIARIENAIPDWVEDLSSCVRLATAFCFSRSETTFEVSWLTAKMDMLFFSSTLEPSSVGTPDHAALGDRVIGEVNVGNWLEQMPELKTSGSSK